MILKSYAKINLSLRVLNKLPNGLHDIQSCFFLINIYDKIDISKTHFKRDIINFKGKFRSYIDSKNNSITKTLKILRERKLLRSYYKVSITKNIPVYSGLGGGSSNAASLIKYLSKKKIKIRDIKNFTKSLGSDLSLFFNKQSYQSGLYNFKKYRKNFHFYFVVLYPHLKCSTKDIYNRYKFRKMSKRQYLPSINSDTMLKYLTKDENSLQKVVLKRHPKLKKVLQFIKNQKGCYFSRMTGSGSTCYGLFTNENSSKVALKKIKKKYPKFSFLTVKTI